MTLHHGDTVTYQLQEWTVEGVIRMAHNNGDYTVEPTRMYDATDVKIDGMGGRFRLSGTRLILLRKADDPRPDS